MTFLRKVAVFCTLPDELLEHIAYVLTKREYLPRQVRWYPFLPVSYFCYAQEERGWFPKKVGSDYVLLHSSLALW